jgi:ankyrin repeat protein
MGWHKGHQLTQLHIAASHGDLEHVRAAIARGERLNRFDEIGKTPLHYAAENGHIEIVKALLEAGANVNANDPSRISNTPLFEIAGNCPLEMAEVSVRAGADPTIRGWMQLCALDRAKDRKRGDGPKVYQLLCKVAKYLPPGHPAT